MTQQGPQLFEAPVFDGTDADGRPVYDRPPVHPQERDGVLQYLQQAPVLVAARSYGPDKLAPAGELVVPLTVHTDGTWVWPGAVGYYFGKYNVPPVPQLVQHIRDRGRPASRLSEAVHAAALDIALGRTAARPLPHHEPRGISEEDRQALDDVRRQLQELGVAPYLYGILEPKLDAVVLEPAPGQDGWQLQFWDASRGPSGRPRVYRTAASAGAALIDMLRPKT